MCIIEVNATGFSVLFEEEAANFGGGSIVREGRGRVERLCVRSGHGRSGGSEEILLVTLCGKQSGDKMFGKSKLLEVTTGRVVAPLLYIITPLINYSLFRIIPNPPILHCRTINNILLELLS